MRKLILTVSVLVLGVAIGLGYLISITERVDHPKLKTALQPRITEKMEVLTPEGTLTTTGWASRRDLFTFDSSKIAPSTSLTPLLNGLRLKKWEFYMFASKDFIFSVASFNLSFIGGIFFHYSSLKDDSPLEFYEEITPIRIPRIKDNCHTNCQSSRYSRSEEEGANIIIHKHYGKHRFQVTFKDFSINIQTDLVPEGEDTLMTLTPMSEDKSLFYFNEKKYNLSAEGKAQFPGGIRDLSEFNVVYDSGKGVWPVKSGWVWISGSGRTEKGERFGLNSGHGFTDPSASHTEDAFFVGGTLFKSGVLNYEVKGEKVIIKGEKQGNYCDIVFTTVKEITKVKNLIFAEVVFNIKYGVFEGSCFENGKEHKLKDVTGLVEDKKSVW